MADVSVRPAVPDDAGEIGRIQVETWRTAYLQVVPAAVLESLDPVTATSAWAAAIGEPPSARHRVLVALEGEWRVGFAAFGPADPEGDLLEADDPARDSTVAVSTLLVEPRWGRRGHGSRLLAALVDHVRPEGATRLIVWIPEADTVTRAFLESAGWSPDGLVRALDTGAGELREIRLRTQLDDG